MVIIGVFSDVKDILLHQEETTSRSHHLKSQKPSSNQNTQSFCIQVLLRVFSATSMYSANQIKHQRNHLNQAPISVGKSEAHFRKINHVEIQRMAQD